LTATLGKSLSLDSLSKAYISDAEIDFIRSFMWDDEGSILDVGAFVGKTFHNLYQHRPNWDYVAVDTWELFPFPMLGPDQWYDRTKMDAPMVHSKYFKENCPFSHFHVAAYEDVHFPKNTFDIIILGAQAPKEGSDKLGVNIQWHYKKALEEIKDDGIIIGRYLNHRRGPCVRESIDIINPENFILEPTKKNICALW